MSHHCHSLLVLPLSVLYLRLRSKQGFGCNKRGEGLGFFVA
ncbi:hypothetical protein GLYMA_08G246980v4 [Glycine max]|nr:hypothetical protein GLYMA_08G246980v4 [Glycine max]KAH1052947.1 hypothetical protein GYH30_022296 [Glycine max]